MAIGTLIEAYWKPVYKYLRIKWHLDPDEAADLTQDFFTNALEKDVLGSLRRGTRPIQDLSAAVRRRLCFECAKGREPAQSAAAA